jgi:hypothetical protein
LHAYAGCATPETVLVVDLEPDGDLDLVVSDYDGRRVWYYLNDGEGTLEQFNWPLPYRPSGGAVADLFGLGADAVFVATTESEGIAAFVPHHVVYPYFQAAPAVQAHQALAIEDFDGDGQRELAVLTDHGAALLHAAVNGYLTAPVKIPVGDNPLDAAFGDLNGDGHIDIVTADNGASQVSVILGLGYGAFELAEAIETDCPPSAVTLADLDGDGDQDLVAVVSDVSFSHAYVYLNDGTGSFGPPASYLIGRLTPDVIAADFNGDGALDLAGAEYAFWGFTILFNDGSGGFDDMTLYGGPREPTRLAAGDVDGDGDLDILTLHPAAHCVMTMLNQGDGTFTYTFDMSFEYGAGVWPSGLVLRDLDGDSALDLATANMGIAAVGVFRNLAAR